MPCPDGVLLRRIWRLVDRELEQRWERLPDLQRSAVGSARGLLGEATGAVRGGGELAADSARTAGSRVVDVLCARLMGDVLAGLRAHHDYTFAHSFRVATHLATFALATGMRRADAELLAQAGLLHDIGKTAIPVAILDKPGPLDSSEWPVVQRHPEVAAEVLGRTPALPGHLIRIALRHHERLDGSGYPQRPRRRRDRRAQPAVRHRRRPHGTDRSPRLPQPAGRRRGLPADAPPGRPAFRAGPVRPLRAGDARCGPPAASPAQPPSISLT